MNSIFRKLLYEGVLANYMDDFIIPAKTMKKIVEKYNLYFKWSKYDFNVEEILILGIVVG